MENHKAEQIRVNDRLIYELLKDERYEIKRNGEVYKIVDGLPHRVDKGDGSDYRWVNFKYKKLNAGRIIFAKYGDSSLIAEKVVNHINGNKHDNRISNLEFVTNSENGIHSNRVLRGLIPKEDKPRLGLSGGLHASNDDLIRELLNDPNYEVRRDGTVWTKVERTGKVSVKDNWREAGSSKNREDGNKPYYDIRYKYKALRRSRILFAKFNGPLQMDLVVNHIDGDTLNDKPNNLELITQSENNIHRYRTLGGSPVIGNSKITQEIAEEIRKLAIAGWTNQRLREKFNVSKSTISYVVNRRIWNV